MCFSIAVGPDRTFRKPDKKLYCGNSRFHDYLYGMAKLFKKHKKLRLFCWCSPKKCHGETIKRYILSLFY